MSTIYKHTILDWDFFFVNIFVFVRIFLMPNYWDTRLSLIKKMSMSFSPFSSPMKFGPYTWHFTFTFTNFFSILWTCIKWKFYFHYYHWWWCRKSSVSHMILMCSRWYLIGEILFNLCILWNPFLVGVFLFMVKHGVQDVSLYTHAWRPSKGHVRLVKSLCIPFSFKSSASCFIIQGAIISFEVKL